jgi:adenylate cyclase
MKNREFFERVVALLKQAMKLDPDYADPYAGLAMAHALDFQNHWTGDPRALDLATDFVKKGIELGPNEPYVHYAASVVYTWRRDLTRARAEADIALSLSPSHASACGTRGLIEVYLGYPLDAVPFIERSIRLEPGVTQQYLHFLGSAYLVAAQYDKAAAAFRERIRLVPNTDLSRAFLASALGHLGEHEEARRMWQVLKPVNPSYSFEAHLARLPFQNPADGERIKEGLRLSSLLN